MGIFPSGRRRDPEVRQSSLPGGGVSVDELLAQEYERNRPGPVLEALAPLLGPENPPLHYPLKWLGQAMETVDPANLTTLGLGVVSAPGSAARSAARWSGAGAAGLKPAQLGGDAGVAAARRLVAEQLVRLRSDPRFATTPTYQALERIGSAPGGAATRDLWEGAARLRANERSVARSAMEAGVPAGEAIPPGVERSIVQTRAPAAQEAAYRSASQGGRPPPAEFNPMGYIEDMDAARHADSMAALGQVRSQVGSPALSAEFQDAAAYLNAGGARQAPPPVPQPTYRPQVDQAAMRAAAERRAASLRAGPGGPAPALLEGGPPSGVAGPGGDQMAAAQRRAPQDWAARTVAEPPAPFTQGAAKRTSGESAKAGGMSFERTAPGAYREPTTGATIQRVDGGFDVTFKGRTQRVRYLSDVAPLLRKG